MSLQLFEVIPASADRVAVEGLLERIERIVSAADAELIESQVTGDHGRVFVVAETGTAEIVDILGKTLTSEALGGAARELTGPHEVRLVGAELAELKAARPGAGYLVEWDLPADLDMDTYLERKRGRAPRYADVPDVTFLRTYVREDMDKCLCFYDGPDADRIRAARRAVDTPIDRLHALDPAKVER